MGSQCNRAYSLFNYMIHFVCKLGLFILLRVKLFSKVEAIVFTFLSITSDVMGNVIYPQFKYLSTKLNSCLSGVKGPGLKSFPITCGFKLFSCTEQ